MADISATSRPGYVFDTTDNVWYPIGTGVHTHEYIPNTLVDAKGDILTATASDTPARLAAGTNGQYLSANSSTATGLEWVTASSGGMTLLETLSLSGASVTSSTIAGTYTDLKIIIRDSYSNNGSAYSMRLNGDTGNNYYNYYIRNDAGTIYGAPPATTSDIYLNVGTATSGGYKNLYYCEMNIARYSSSNYKSISQTVYNGGVPGFYLRYAIWDNTAAITSITIKCDGGTFSAGNAYIYGVK